MKKQELKNRISQLELQLRNSNSIKFEFLLLEQKNKEKELKKSEERIHLAAETSGIGIWEWNVITNQVHWNAKMFHIHGVTPTADGFVNYSAWSDTLAPEDLAEQEQILNDTVRNIGTSKRSFKIFRANDGVVCHIEAIETIRTNTAGEVEWVVGTNIDVTDRKKAEQKLQESEHHFANMVYSSPSLISILKGENLIVEIANNAIVESWGKGKDVIGKPLLEIVPELIEQGFAEIFNKVYTTGISFEANEKPIYVMRNGKMKLSYYTFIYQAQRDINNSIEGISIIGYEVTPQAEYNINLRESEERFRSLADNVPLHIFIVEPDKEATISYWNKNWLDYIGQPLEQAKGNTWGGVMHPDDLEGVMDMYLPAFEKRQPYFIPGIRVRRHDGEYRWHSVQANPRYLINGEFMGYIGVGIDIHQSKLAQDALKASEEHFRKMANLMPAKVSNANINGEVTYTNKSWLDFSGFGFDELRDFGYHKIIHPDELEEFQTRFQNAAATLTDLVMEMRFKNSEGNYVWHLNIASPIKDKDGRLKMWVCVTTDISDQKKQREELEKAVTKRTRQLLNLNKELEKKQQELFDTKEKLLNEYARSLIEASPDPLFTISLAGEITDFNEASSKITGISREKLKGTNFINYFTDPEKALKGYNEVFENGFVANYPLTIKDVNLTPVLFNGSVYKDGKGNIIGAVAVARVITEQKRFEKELTEAKVSAENAAESKQRFLSNMSHEIRTPLNSILGFTNVLLKAELGEKQKEYIQAIKTSGVSLNVLINDILDLAKVNAGKMTFEKQPFEIHKSIIAILHSFDLKIKEKNLEIVQEYDSKIPLFLLGDSVRLNQILLNLISNAVKFTHKGTIILNVKLLCEDKENATIEFGVTDSGIGIAENKIDSIFNVFEQAEISTSNSYGGTGLGLAIVKQLLEAQGGTISVKSKIAEGSRFSFTLPFGKTTMRAEESIEIQTLDSKIKNRRVLVAEDVPLNQLLIKIILNDFGFDYEVVENGKIAIEKLQTNTYDIILMDLQMPEMNGFEATEYIRKTMKSKIPIIALTADVTTVDVFKCKEFGMDDYISKPIDENLLYIKIMELLKKENVIIDEQI
jgi:PAS domain S-box-containing protein